MRKDYFKKGLVLSIIILFIGASIVPNTCRNNKDKEYFTYKSGNLTITYHLATREEIEEMKKKDGVYDPIIDETGSSSPSIEEEYEEMVGTLRITDNVYNPCPLNSSYLMEEEDYFPPVGKQIGPSCSSWATTYYTNGYMQARDHGWPANTGNKTYLLNPYFTFEGELKYNSNVIKRLQTIGVCRWVYMEDPYEHMGEYAWRDAPLFRVGDYYTIGIPVEESEIEEIKSLLSDGHKPMPFSIDGELVAIGSTAFGDDWVLGSNVIKGDADHAITICGYDDTIQDNESGEIGAFRIVDSQGTNMYDNGFYWITYESFKKTTWALGTIHYMDDFYVGEECPHLIATWEFKSGDIPNWQYWFYINLTHRDQPNSPPVATKKFRMGLDKDMGYYKFMCLGITDDFYEIWMQGVDPDVYNFSLDIVEYGSWPEDGSVELFDIEYYENYNLGNPYQQSRKTVPPDLKENPIKTPCTIWVKDFNYSLAPTDLVLTGTFDNIEGGRWYRDPPYNFSAEDHDTGDKLYYYWDWGDDNNSGWRGPFNSTEVDSQEKGWELNGTYNMTVIAEDKGGFRNITNKTIDVSGDNDKPNDSAIPTIEKKPGTNNTYIFKTKTFDPENNDVKHEWQWKKLSWINWSGDSTGFNASGEEVTHEEILPEKGFWQVRVRAHDIWGKKYKNNWSYNIKLVNFVSGCPEGTQINMAYEDPPTKNIENIVVGDIINSYDITNELVVPARVIAVHEYTQELPETLLDINYNIQDNIEITSNHFLFINGTEWMEAGDAGIGYDILENPPGTNTTSLKQITLIDELSLLGDSIYDLEIIPITSENASGYFANSILVGGFL